MSKSQSTRILTLAAFCAAGATGAQPTSPDPSDSLRQATGSPAAAVGIWAPDQRHVWVSGHETRGGPAVDDTARWHLGSITKSFTALLVARLAEQGVISWDDRLGDVLPDVPDVVQAVTYADLLTHRAGLPANESRLRSLWQMMFPGTATVTQQRATYVAAVLKRARAPGEFLYSNAGYVTVAAMIETVTGEPWETLIAREIFAPLGLDSAGFGPPAAGPMGHSGAQCRPAGRKATADNPVYLAPAGGVHISMDDLLSYLAAHAERPAWFLPAAAWSRLHTAWGDYAMGWIAEEAHVTHAGSNTFWFAQVYVAQDPPRAMAGVINCADGRELVPMLQEWWRAGF